MRLEELINRYYQDLNENDIYIWNYIQQHKKECEMMSIDELAMHCHVSRTTILRFAQKLSLKGYGELKVYLRLDNQQKQTSGRYLDQVIEIYQHIMETMRTQDFQRIFRKLNQAKKLYVYGSGAVQSSAASEMKRIFQTCGKFFFTIAASDESDTLADMIEEEDLVFIISLSGESNHVCEFAKKLKMKNVSLISITREKDNTLAHLCDDNLYISTMYAQLGNQHTPFEASTSFFILIEMLYLRHLEYQEGEKEV